MPLDSATNGIRKKYDRIVEAEETGRSGRTGSSAPTGAEETGRSGRTESTTPTNSIVAFPNSIRRRFRAHKNTRLPFGRRVFPIPEFLCPHPLDGHCDHRGQIRHRASCNRSHHFRSLLCIASCISGRVFSLSVLSIHVFSVFSTIFTNYRILHLCKLHNSLQCKKLFLHCILHFFLHPVRAIPSKSSLFLRGFRPILHQFLTVSALRCTSPTAIPAFSRCLLSKVGRPNAFLRRPAGFAL